MISDEKLHELMTRLAEPPTMTKAQAEQLRTDAHRLIDVVFDNLELCRDRDGVEHVLNRLELSTNRETIRVDGIHYRNYLVPTSTVISVKVSPTLAELERSVAMAMSQSQGNER